MVNKNFEYRIDWTDALTGEHCVDFLSEASARWEAQNDYMHEIFSITRILNNEGEESENLLEAFQK
jgi:uncharacterized membrane protein YjdF